MREGGLDDDNSWPWCSGPYIIAFAGGKLILSADFPLSLRLGAMMNNITRSTKCENWGFLSLHFLKKISVKSVYVWLLGIFRNL